MSNRRSRTLAMVLAVLVLALGAVSSAAPAQAAKTVTIIIREGGTTAAGATASVGDKVVFKNAATAAFAVNGDFVTPGALAPGATSGAFSLPTAKTYSYTIAFADLLPSGGGTLVVTRAATPTPTTPTPTRAPTRAPTAPPVTAPPPATSPAALPPGTLPTLPPSAPTLAPANPGGNGVALQPRLDGGLQLPAPTSTIPGLAPQVAPDGSTTFPTADPGLGFATTPPTAGPGIPTLSTQTEASSLTTRLNDPSELRRYGLPAVVGLVLLAGAFSLILRVLFATTGLREWLRGDVRIHRPV